MKEFYQDAYFEKLTTEQLEQMIDLGLELPARENREALLQILEVLEERENSVDVEKAWEEFQRYYNIPEGKGIELYETGEFPEVKEAGSEKKKEESRVVSFPSLRAVGRVAVVAAVTFILMITTAVAVQAAGYDVFGAMGRWTDETFQFNISDDTSENTIYEKEFGEALQSVGILEDLFPTWYPEGFVPSDIISAPIEGAMDSVVCGYDNEEEDRHYTIDVDRFYDKQLLENLVVEKNDKDEVEMYTRNNRTFYIMLNNFGYTAAWTDGELFISIGGNLSKIEMKKIIDSIGG